MRLVSDDFGKRSNKELLEKKKYFLIYEGEVTEPMYFNGIAKNKGKLSISESINLVSVLRSIYDKSKSHPCYVLELARNIISKSDKDKITKEELQKNIVDYLSDNKPNNYQEMINLAASYFKDYSNSEIALEEIDNVILDIYKDEIFEDISTNILVYLNNQSNLLDYNSDIDEINLIVDRDKGSFKEEQYDKLVNECNANNIHLYVSNPCFECWLLMHFDEFENLNFDKLLENKRISGHAGAKKYTDKKLSDITGHDKLHLQFENFIDKIDGAIKREHKYCENLKCLKNNIGSNVGILIENLRKK